MNNFFKRLFRKKNFIEKPEIEETRTDDGRILRRTVTTSRHTFRFLGDDYNMDILFSAKWLSTFHFNNCYSCLHCDNYGRLFLKTQRTIHHYHWDETNQYTFCFVKSERAAFRMAGDNTKDLPQIVPCIFHFTMQNRFPDIVLAQEYLSAEAEEK